mgnify:CR=1 FL=1
MSESKTKLVIVGLGETAELATEYFNYDSSYQVCAYAAEEEYIEKKLQEKTLLGCPVVPVEKIEELFSPTEYVVFVAMAYGRLNHDRARMYKNLKAMGYKFASYVSSRAFVARETSIGENCFILENNVIQRNVRIGNNVILWSGNHIGHRTVIEDNVFLSSHVAVSGFCHIGEYSFLGINSCLGDNVTVARNNFIGGGVVLMRDTKENELYRMPVLKPERLSSKMVFGFSEK